MPKRNFSVVAKKKDTEEYIDEDSVLSVSEVDSDASFVPAKSIQSKSKYKTRTPKNLKRKRDSTPNDSEDDPSENIDSSSNRDFPHFFKLHQIHDPIPIQNALLSWFSTVHSVRGMPWRKMFDPDLSTEERSQRAYEVWIAEIMLQQTQVVTVIPYYNRWMKEFPTLSHLAFSNIETVNRLWKGLGYYSRASRLLLAAQKIQKDHNGIFPNNAEDMIKSVPGIGKYTAGAISSIAFGLCEPVLDGNITRLLTRFLAIYASPKSKSTLNILWTAAEKLVEGADVRKGDAGNINQALIELGSTVCKVRNPACGECPVKAWCLGIKGIQPLTEKDINIEDLCTICEPLPMPISTPISSSTSTERDVTIYPMKIIKKKVREETDVVCVVEWRNTHRSTSDKEDEDRWFLLVRRPDKGLLAGLHDFPSIPNIDDVESISNYSNIPKKKKNKLEEMVKTLIGTIIANEIEGINVHTNTNTKSTSKSNLRIENIQLVGDVVHVFSHIRKTYCTLWVVLVGSDINGEGILPKLRVHFGSASGETVKKSGKFASKSAAKRGKKAKILDDEGVEDVRCEIVKDESNLVSKIAPEDSENLKWVKLDDVADANIGTGVMKIWSKVRSYWES